MIMLTAIRHYFKVGLKTNLIWIISWFFLCFSDRWRSGGNLGIGSNDDLNASIGQPCKFHPALPILTSCFRLAAAAARRIWHESQSLPSKMLPNLSNSIPHSTSVFQHIQRISQNNCPKAIIAPICLILFCLALFCLTLMQKCLE